MKSLFKILTVTLIATTIITSCKKSPSEKVKDGFEEVGEGIKESAEKTHDNIKEGVEEVKDEIDDATTK